MNKFVNNWKAYSVILLSVLNLLYLGFIAQDAVDRIIGIAVGYLLAFFYIFLTEDDMGKKTDKTEELDRVKKTGFDAGRRGDSYHQHLVELSQMNESRKKAWMAGFLEGVKEFQK